MKINKSIQVLCLITLLSGCGGGGGDTSKPVNNDSGSSGKAEFVKPDYQNTPIYNGETSLFEITASNVTQLTTQYSYLLDSLNSIVFGEDYQNLFLHDPVLSNQSDHSGCVTGSTVMKEEEANQHYIITYNNCSAAGWVFNGQSDIYIESSNAEFVLEYGIVPNLTISNEVLGVVYSTEGFAIASSEEENSDSSAIVNILFKGSDESSHDILFSDVRLDAVLDATNIGYGIGFNGDIYFSDLGKLTVKTDKFYPNNDIALPPIVGAQYSFVSQNTALAELKGNDISSIRLTNEFIPLEFYLADLDDVYNNEVNSAPRADILAPDSIRRNSIITLDASQSKDPDLEPLGYEWKLTAFPENASWQISTGSKIEFLGDLPGLYRISLTVVDPSGAENTAEHEFKLEKLPAIVSDITAYDEIELGEHYTAIINLSNDEVDGPFEYKIAYGPSNISISEQGEVNWLSNAPDFGSNLKVNFAVDISNSDTQTRAKHQINLHSRGGVDNHSVGYVNNSTSGVASIKLSNNKRGVLRSNVDYVLNLSETGFLEYNKWIPPLPLNAEHVGAFLNQSGTQLNWLSITYNQEAAKHQIFLSNEDSSSLLIDDVAAENYNSMVFDYNGDDIEDILLSAGHSYDSYLINGNDLSITKLIVAPDLSLNYSNSLIQVCDLNNDGFKELIDRGNIFDVKQNKYLIEPYSEYEFKAFTSGGNCRVTRYKASDHYSELIWWEDGELQVSIEKFETNFHDGISIGLEVDSPYSHVYFSSSKELHYFDQQWQLFSVSIDENPFGRVIGAVDFDNDGIQSLLVSKTDSLEGSYLYEEYTMQSFSYENGRWQLEYSSVPQGQLPNLHIVGAVNDTVSVSDFGRSAQITHNNAPVTFTGEMLLTQDNENQIEYSLTQINNETFIVKRNIGSTSVIWQTSVSEVTFSNSYDFAFTESETHLSFKSGTRYFTIVKQTGEVVSRVFFPYLPSEEMSKIIIGYYDLGIAFYENPSLLPISIDSSNWPVPLDFLQESTSHVAHVHAIQLDSDPQLELIIDYRTFGSFDEEGGLIVLDTKTKALEILDGQQTKGFTIYHKEKILDEAIGGVYGRNYLAQYSIEKTISLVDKLSNQVIWESPQISNNYHDVLIQKDERDSWSLYILGSEFLTYPYLN
ncbi:PKD domain-containing protein [Pseudoalteromonas sp. C12FD-1]|uniref:PKD domain-containing protein n=1 Tax=Pseudoalteromonas sp. C12FD-1 TaxID=3131979 RepID=UPI00307E1232